MAEPRAEVQFSLVESKFVHFFAINIKAHILKTEFSLAPIIIFFLNSTTCVTVMVIRHAGRLGLLITLTSKEDTG